MFLGYFTSTTTRNARGVTTADVEQRATCIVGGVMYEAILAGATSASWRRVAASGTWVPTATAGTNLDSVGTATGRYMVIGDIVHVSFRVLLVDPTAGSSGATEMGLSLPIASAFSAATQADGVCSGNTVVEGYVIADATEDRLSVNWESGGTAAVTLYGVASYQII
jgi:hypothetical protein